MKIRFFGLLVAGWFAAAGVTRAEPITDFTGLEVTVAVNVISNGGQNFSVGLITSNTAIIGEGAEFSMNAGGNGIYSYSQGTLNLDFDASGHVFLYADSQLAIGNTSFTEFSFDISFMIDGAFIRSVSTSGDLVRGSASADGLDPVVWTFVNERDNSFGQVMTFGTQISTTPELELTADTQPIPEPAAVPVFALLSLALARRRCAVE